MDTAVKITSAITVALGVVVTGIGCHSYFESWWNDQMRTDLGKATCEQMGEQPNKMCPPLAMEMYFVSISIITLFLSLAFLVARFFVKSGVLDKIGAVYNILAAVLVFVGGVAVGASAVLVHNLLEGGLNYDRNGPQLFDEKIAAGAISCLNGVMYLVAGILGCCLPCTRGRTQTV